MSVLSPPWGPWHHRLAGGTAIKRSAPVRYDRYEMYEQSLAGVDLPEPTKRALATAFERMHHDLQLSLKNDMAEELLKRTLHFNQMLIVGIAGFSVVAFVMITVAIRMSA
jgi:hypothetical protein